MGPLPNGRTSFMAYKWGLDRSVHHVSDTWEPILQRKPWASELICSRSRMDTCPTKNFENIHPPKTNMSHGRSTPYIGNPYNGYINLYYWVDDHLQLQGTNGSLDPSTHGGPQNDGLEKVTGPFKHGNCWYLFVRLLGCMVRWSL